MSTPLLPWLPGLTFQRGKSAMAGNTMIQTSESGKEVRISTQVRPRWNYELIYEVLRANGSRGAVLGQYANANQVPLSSDLLNSGALIDDEFAVLQGFVIGRAGAAGDFLYDDPSDNTAGLYRVAVADGTTASWQTAFTYSPLLYVDQAYEDIARVLNSFGPWSTASINGSGLVTASPTPSKGQLLYVTNRAASSNSTYYPGEQFGTGDGSTVAFQLTRTIGGRATGFAEAIQNLNAGSGAPAIWDNGTLKTVITDYTIGMTGIVTFTSAPVNGHVLSWAGKFYQRLRFLKDDPQFDELLARLWEGKKVEAISVLL